MTTDIFSPKKENREKWPVELTTDEIKTGLGNFERELDEFYNRQPASRRNWEWFLHSKRAITGGRIHKWTDKKTGNEHEYIQDYEIFAPNLTLYEELNEKKKMLDTLNARRIFAEKKNDQQREQTLGLQVEPEDEINISDIPF